MAGAHTTFTNGVTLTDAAWFQDVDTVAYTLFGNGTSYTGVLTLAGTTQSTSTTTGQAIIAGGMGLAKNLWVGGTGNFAGTLTGVAITATSTVTGLTFVPTGSSAPTNGMFLPAANTIGLSANSAEVWRIDSDGYVGVGVTPASSQMGITGAVPKYVNYVSASVNGMLIKSFSSGGLYSVLELARSNSNTIGTQSATQNGDALGYVSWAGVNTSNAPTWMGYIAVKQVTAPGVTYNGATMDFYLTTTTGSSLILNLNYTGNVQFAQYGAGTLTTNGSGVISATSDITQKNIIGPFTRGLEALRGWEPIMYEWNTESGLQDGLQYAGFGAQHILPYIPEAVYKGKNGLYTVTDRPVLMAVVNAIKQLDTRLNTLEVKLGIQ